MNNTYENLIDEVIERIKTDVRYKNYTAIEEMLKTIPIQTLIAFLSEEDGNKFNHLTKNI